ncbi:hypothetical protein [Maritalea sp.]|uniref:hypothetical protein n=1 Tax=Maritalea sp. TaxID=2003361 RepID=UPI0039E47A5D
MKKWEIKEYDGLDIKATYIAEDLSVEQISSVMQMLIARYLSASEIIDQPRLYEIRKDGGTLSCGENPHVVARKVS